ncbi:MAG: prepilin-type N-terminal cleavage/methylation domain-containing protein [Candidatus Paceibacterota bacterium]|jgi:prepilin-type N-terminal cleavage/methylation domain-containing protein
MKNNFYKKGITILEILIAIAILGIIVAIALPQFSKMRENQVLKNATSEILSSISKARSQTLSSVDSSEYGVHFQSDKVIIFKGNSFDINDEDNENIEIILPANISSINFSGGGSEIYFSRLSGIPNKTGTIIISTSNMTKTITISATGLASLN